MRRRSAALLLALAASLALAACTATPVYRFGAVGNQGKIAQLERGTPTVVAGITGKVIQIATHNSAVFLGKADQMGAIDTGQLADMVLLTKDPSVDIHNTKSILFVMKDGQIIDESKLPLAGGPQKRRFSGGV